MQPTTDVNSTLLEFETVSVSSVPPKDKYLEPAQDCCTHNFDESFRSNNEMAAAVDSRKRCVAAFLDEPSPAPPHLANKRGRFVPCAASMAPLPAALAPFDPLDAFRRVFPDADPRGLEACFAASGRDINAAVHAYRAQQARDALAHHLASAAAGGDDQRCAAVLVEQMGAATDVEDAKNRATWMLRLIKNATAERAAHEAAAETTRLREENTSLREHAERGATETAMLHEENAALRERAAAAERDGTVLKRGVLAQQRRYEEMERDAAAMKKKVAELEMANYVLNVRLRDADGCRLQAAYRGPDVC
ncbi:hypothetical protein QYE76_051334 [Lolium multiflorum]|uniref:Uncharacterized protein n=1 Tax=Lolium multiflorum TaxID=4521 RepID=A0AAD8WKF1_LOLMU|nr:hypothetical protein QYE76_051334 [Lolium multiflorum]